MIHHDATSDCLEPATFIFQRIRSGLQGQTHLSRQQRENGNLRKMFCGTEVAELLTLLSRYSMSPAQVQRATHIARTAEFNWNGFLAAAFKHKVAGLIYYTAQRYKIRTPQRIWQILRLFYAANAARSQLMHDEVDRLAAGLTEHGVDARALKGAVLGRLVYTDGGSRFQNDIDLFIRRSQAPRVIKAMAALGYGHGIFSRYSGELKPHSREELVLWRLKMFNLPPFARPIDSPFMEAMYVDVTYGLSFGLEQDVSELLLQRTGIVAGVKTLDPVDFLVHLCCHLHKEATNEAWEELGQSINLIKFCDIREYIICRRTLLQADRLNLRVTQLGVQEAMQFALGGVVEVYGDDETRLLVEGLGYTPCGPARRSIFRQGDEVVGERVGTFIDALATI